MTTHLLFRFLGMTTVISLAMGCGGFSVRESTPPARAEFLRHTLRSGESLGLLAEWYTGKTEAWREFYLPAPSRGLRHLKVGDEILIPRHVANRDIAPSDEFVKKYRSGMVPVARTAHRRPAKASKAPVEARGPAEQVPQTAEAEGEVEAALEQQPEKRPPVPANEPDDLEKAFMEQIIGH